MTDRFPLIINSEDQQIQELSSGDNLDLTGSGIVSDVFTVDTNSQERLRIDSSGRLGIGTTEPSSNIGSTPVLDISGTYGGLALSSSVPSANKVEIGNFGYNTMVFATDSVERMRIDSSGKVGINQSSPTAFIHAKSGANDGTVIGTFEGATNNKLDIKFNSTGPALNVTAGDPLVFEIGGTERMRIDSAGRLLLGTTSNYAQQNADNLLIGDNQSSARIGITLGSTIESGIRFADSANNSAGIIEYFHTDDSLRIATNASERMRIDSSGRMGLGTTSPIQKLDVRGSVYVGDNIGINESTPTEKLSVAGAIIVTSNANNFAAATGGSIDYYNHNMRIVATGTSGVNNGMTFFTTNSGSNSERMRIDSAGRLLVGTSSSTDASVVFQNTQQASFRLNNTNSSPIGMQIRYTTDLNNIANRFIDCIGNATSRFIVRSNGGVENYSSNNVNLCDEREKKNIASLDEKWDKVKSWELKKFHYNEDADTDDLRYGVIAQQVETTCPEVLTEWEKQSATEANLDEDGNVVTPAAEQILRKGVREQQMMWMAIKALQEAQTRIETLETEVAALKAS